MPVKMEERDEQGVEGKEKWGGLMRILLNDATRRNAIVRHTLVEECIGLLEKMLTILR